MAGKEKDKKSKVVAKVKVPSARKRELQDIRRRARNRTCTSQVKTAVRGFREALEEGSAEDPVLKLQAVYALVDKGVKKGIVPANRANRTKSRLAKKLVSLQKD